MKSIIILLVKKLLGLVEMMSGLVNASFSLCEWQAVKMIFFAPWVRKKKVTNLTYPENKRAVTHRGPNKGEVLKRGKAT